MSTTNLKLQKISDQLIESIWKEVKLHFVTPPEYRGCSPEKCVQFVSIIRKLVGGSQRRYLEIFARRKATHGTRRKT